VSATITHDGRTIGNSKIGSGVLCPSPRFAALLPLGVITAECCDFRLALADLPDEEARLVARAVTMRQAEFAGGRMAARTALAAMGIAGATIGVGDDRAPIWPAGIVGTITHKAAFAAAAVATRTSYAGLGIDSEVLGRVTPALWSVIVSDEEQPALRGLAPDEQNLRATLLFAAKEAYFKAQYPGTRRLLGFHSGVVSIDGDRIRVENRAASDRRDIYDKAEGRFLVDEGFVHVAVWIDAA